MPEPERTFRVLFLCTGNSARSIMAEAILNRMGQGRFAAFSAGSHPRGEVNPYAITLLARLGYDVSYFRSKSWDEFAIRPGAQDFDAVITVCDDAAREACPLWPGQPVTAHWGIADPAQATGTPAVVRQAFAEAYRRLEKRIEALLQLPLSELGQSTMRMKLIEIGRMEAFDRSALTDLAESAPVADPSVGPAPQT
jgi:protein-tyrosine-phosphatase